MSDNRCILRTNADHRAPKDESADPSKLWKGITILALVSSISALVLQLAGPKPSTNMHNATQLSQLIEQMKQLRLSGAALSSQQQADQYSCLYNNTEGVVVALGRESFELFEGTRWAGVTLHGYEAPTFPGIAEWRNRLFVSGGSFDGTPVATVNSIGTKGSVVSYPDLPRVVGLPAAVVYKGYNRLQSVYIFDGVQWRTGPSLKQAGRSGIKCLVFKDLLYCLGGFGKSGGWTAYDFVEVYNGSVWTAGPAMPIQNFAFSATVLQDKM